ncbi:MAG: UDP-N-acetylmuramoyl-L-alanyl-D-glutamate--2,6-diaminopimelate ligase, partial [Lachnospiraceae bacterium]|nr:UDP-N-acetylmuramoyl-L-alanyl-D-glutamate--2,6-diaminopimelate ligase [Lachnospiraceae bacterium]
MLKDWLEGLSCTLVQGSLEVEAEEVLYDSRKAAPGAVFVCMAGSRVDSHKFIPQVLKAGVKVLVVEHPVEVPEDVTVLLTDNGRRALALLSAARFGHPSRKLTMIGVTGTKGKTTTTHMIRTVLETAGKKTGMIGTNGVFIGQDRYPTMNTTPESYDLHRYFARMVEEGCECCVMEVSSQAFKMHRVDGIVYDYALFTNISPDHIGPDEHESFEEYLYCKTRIFTQCRFGLVNVDDAHMEEITREIPCRWEGFG